MILSTLAPLVKPANLMVFLVLAATEFMTLVWVAGLQRRRIGQARALQDSLFQFEQRVKSLEALSYLDPLTGLRSGLLFRAEFDELGRASRSIALLYIDLDDFRTHNQGGHREVGDAALRSAAEALREAIRRRSDRLYRLHGDEFVVVLPNAGADVAAKCAQQIIGQLAQRHLSATIGGACSEILPWRDLERAADLACQTQKQDQKGRYRLATQIPQSDGVPTPIQVETPERLPAAFSLAGGAP